MTGNERLAASARSLISPVMARWGCRTFDVSAVKGQVLIDWIDGPTRLLVMDRLIACQVPANDRGVARHYSDVARGAAAVEVFTKQRPPQAWHERHRQFYEFLRQTNAPETRLAPKLPAATKEWIWGWLKAQPRPAEDPYGGSPEWGVDLAAFARAVDAAAALG